MFGLSNVEEIEVAASSIPIAAERMSNDIVSKQVRRVIKSIVEVYKSIR